MILTKLLLTVGTKSMGNLVLQLAALGMMLCLLPFALIADALISAFRSWRGRRVLACDVALCPRGHEVSLHGAWQCENCSLVSVGSGLGSCPHCSEQAYAVLCPCGLPIVNPLVRR